AGIALRLRWREPKANGSWSRPKDLSLKHSQIAELPLAEDREICALLIGARGHYGWSFDDNYSTIPVPCQVTYPFSEKLMPLLARTGRSYLSTSLTGEIEGDPLLWDEGSPWQFILRLQPAGESSWTTTGILCRDNEQMDISTPVFLTKGL